MCDWWTFPTDVLEIATRDGFPHLLIEAGVDLKTIQERLGHKNIK
jgi:site-specific recombinase XerD